MMRHAFPTLALTFSGRFLPAVDQAQQPALAAELDSSGCVGAWTKQVHIVETSGGIHDGKPAHVETQWTFEAASDEDAKIAQRHLDSVA
jgi:hypothetical protein